MGRLVWLVLVAVFCFGGAAEAQELRGTVRLPDGVSPAAGAIVVVQHATRDSVLARGITGERGNFSIRLTTSGDVRVSVLRIGFRPMQLGLVTIRPGGSNLEVTLENNPVILSAITTNAAARCELRPDSGELVTQLHDEVKKALLATTIRSPDGRSTATYSLFSRVQERNGRPRGAEERTTHNGFSDQPFASVSSDSLAKVGYMLEDRNGDLTFFAPDAQVLLSEQFISTHCFHLVPGRRERAEWIGLGFRPVNRPRNRVDVQGTLWIERGSTELQLLEYSYVGVPDEFERARVGGAVEFTALPDGQWFVSRWTIRMPLSSQQQTTGFADYRRRGTEMVVDAILVRGGEVLDMQRNGEVLYSSLPSTPLGAPAFTARAEPQRERNAVADADAVSRFRIDTLSEASAATCVGNMPAQYSGIVAGKVVRGRESLADVPVRVEWQEEFRVTGQHQWTWRTRQLTTRTAPDGVFLVCGAATSRAVKVVAQAGEDASRPITLRLTGRERKVEVTLDVAPRVVPVLTVARGTVLHITGPGDTPVSHAVVTMSNGGKRVGDEQGRVIMPVVTGDSTYVQVRRIGFRAYDGWVRRPNSGEPFTLTLSPIAQTLDAIYSRARERTPLERSGFYDRIQQVQRGAYSGEFFTPEDLEARPAMRLTQFLSSSKYVRFRILGASSQMELVGRGNCKMTVILDGSQVQGLRDVSDYDASKGGMAAARASVQVTIDQLVDFNSIKAIEVYPSVSMAPGSIAPLAERSNCGVVVIWTR